MKLHFLQLIDRIQKTISHLNMFKPEQINGSEEKEITLQMRDNTLFFLKECHICSILFTKSLFSCHNSI